MFFIITWDLLLESCNQRNPSQNTEKITQILDGKRQTAWNWVSDQILISSVAYDTVCYDNGEQDFLRAVPCVQGKVVSVGEFRGLGVPEASK